MQFQLINPEQWKRKPYFDHYVQGVPCTFSMTVKLEITQLRRRKRKLYPTLLHGIATVVNRHEEFRTCFDEENRLGIYDVMFPGYTIFHKETETFSNSWTEYFEGYDELLVAYEEDMRQYGGVEGLCAKPGGGGNIFPVSMLPWESFDGFNLNLQKGFDYLLPIFTLGKFYEEGEKTWLPLAIQVHHGVCDGFHVCRFVAELRAYLEKIL
ncbi:MAG: type A chloramphenicol O-acetyltransferase [Anaerovoracaceae bacterium]